MKVLIVGVRIAGPTLAYWLLRAGHEVTLVTHARFEPLVAGSGVRFHPLPVDPRAELESSRGRGLHRVPA